MRCNCSHLINKVFFAEQGRAAQRRIFAPLLSSRSVEILNYLTRMACPAPEQKNPTLDEQALGRGQQGPSLCFSEAKRNECNEERGNRGALRERDEGTLSKSGASSDDGAVS